MRIVNGLIALIVLSIVAASGPAGALTFRFSGSSVWVPVEICEFDDTIYPLHVTDSGDTWSAEHWFDPGADVEVSISRPESSMVTFQSSVANDIVYSVQWHIEGPGTPANIQVQSIGKVGAIIYRGTSVNLNPQGDWAACTMVGDIGLSAITYGYTAQFFDEPSKTIVQVVSPDNTVTSSVKIHPTAGLTKPGDYHAYGRITYSKI